MQREPGKNSNTGTATVQRRPADAATPGRQTLVQQLPHADASSEAQARGPVQRAGSGDADASRGVHAAAIHGISGASTPLPHRDAIQRLFGRHDVSHVQGHVGGAAAEGARAMGAEAFATGNHVAFASQPDLHTAAHEAAHVVQQRAGVQLKGGVGEVGDVYERHADDVAAAVVQGKSAEGLLDQLAGDGAAAAGTSPVQRATRTTVTRTAATRTAENQSGGGPNRRAGGSRAPSDDSGPPNHGEPSNADSPQGRTTRKLRLRVTYQPATATAGHGGDPPGGGRPTKIATEPRPDGHSRRTANERPAPRADAVPAPGNRLVQLASHGRPTLSTNLTGQQVATGAGYENGQFIPSSGGHITSHNRTHTFVGGANPADHDLTQPSDRRGSTRGGDVESGNEITDTVSREDLMEAIQKNKDLAELIPLIHHNMKDGHFASNGGDVASFNEIHIYIEEDDSALADLIRDNASRFCVRVDLSGSTVMADGGHVKHGNRTILHMGSESEDLNTGDLGPG